MLEYFFNLKLFNFISVKNILIIFFIFSLPSGPLIPDLVVVFFAVSFLIVYIHTKSYFKSKFFLFIFIFWCYLIINSFFSSVPLISFQVSIPYIRFLFFIFFIAIFFKKKTSLEYFFYSFLLLYLILFIDCVYQLTYGHNILGYVLDFSERVSSFFGEELILGGFVSKTFAILIFLIFFLKLKYKYFFYTIVVLLSGLLVYLSRERSSFFVFCVTFLFSIFLIEKKKILKIISIIISLFFLLFLFYSKPFDRLYNHTKNQLKETNALFLSERHKYHYLTAYKIFRENPFFGAGIKSFRYLCNKNPYSVTNDIILNNTFTSKRDGYYFHYLEPSKDISSVFVFDKVFFEEHVFLFNRDNIVFLLKHIDRWTKHFDEYLIDNKKYFLKKRNNFEFVKEGMDIFSYYEFHDGCNTHPHNFYIQFLSETGIVGFLFIIGYIFFILKSLLIRIYIYVKEDKISHDIVIFGLYFSVFFPLLPSGNFFNNYNSLLLYLPLAFIILCHRR